MSIEIRGLLLDAGNILYDDTYWRLWLFRLLKRVGLETHFRPFFHLFDRDFLPNVHCGRQTFDEALAAYLASAGLSPGQIEEVQAAWQSHGQDEREHSRALTGVRETLGQLNESGITLGVLCDCEHFSTDLAARLERRMLASLWKGIVSSRDLERSMPDRSCYLAGLKVLEMPADQVAFVSNDSRKLAGARRSGLSTIAFNAPAGVQADFHPVRFENLLEIVCDQHSMSV